MPNCANCKIKIRFGNYCMLAECRSARSKKEWVHIKEDLQTYNLRLRARRQFKRDRLKAQRNKNLGLPVDNTETVDLIKILSTVDADYLSFIQKEDRLLTAALSDPEVMKNRSPDFPYRCLIHELSDFAQSFSNMPTRLNGREL